MCPSERYGRGGAPPREARAPLRPAFDVLDADQDGRIGRDDLKAFYSSSSSSSSSLGASSDAAVSDENRSKDEEEAIGSMITAADADRDGYVGFEEFERVVLRGGGGGVMEEVFRVMDRDGDGRVGFGDLRGYMDWAGLPATDDDIRAMLRLGGGQQEEGVCYDGLLRILTLDFFSS